MIKKLNYSRLIYYLIYKRITANINKMNNYTEPQTIGYKNKKDHDIWRWKSSAEYLIKAQKKWWD